MSKYSTVKYVAVACKLWISQQYTKVNQYLHCLTFQYTHWLEVKKKSKDRYFSEHQSWAWSPYSRFRLNLSPLTGSNMLVNTGPRIHCITCTCILDLHLREQRHKLKLTASRSSLTRLVRYCRAVGISVSLLLNKSKVFNCVSLLRDWGNSAS